MRKLFHRNVVCRSRSVSNEHIAPMICRILFLDFLGVVLALHDGRDASTETFLICKSYDEREISPLAPFLTGIQS